MENYLLLTGAWRIPDQESKDHGRPRGKTEPESHAKAALHWGVAEEEENGRTK